MGMSYVGLDFETYGAINLPKHGLHRYINNPTFKPLLASSVQMEWDGEIKKTEVFDLVESYADARDQLFDTIYGRMIVAHHAGFEQAVLRVMGLDLPSSRFIDSAVLARAAGAAGKLEAAAPQLLGVDKMEVGGDLIKLFSMPGEYQAASGSVMFDPQIRIDRAQQWEEFGTYCGVNAELSVKLAALLLPLTSDQELANMAVTLDMNNTGWHVDLAAVEEMERRYLLNLETTVNNFLHDVPGTWELNLNSQP